MNKDDIKKLNRIVGIAMSAADKALMISDKFLNSSDMKNIQYSDPALFEFPNLRQVITDTELSGGDYSITKLQETVIALSDRLIALKVLLTDLASILEAQTFRYYDISAYYPYLMILLDQIEQDRDDINDWFEDNLEGKLDFDLRENQDLQVVTVLTVITR